MSALTQAVTVGLFMALFGGSAVHGQTGTVLGSVRTTLPDGASVAIPGVRVTVTCGSGATFSTLSDEEGQVQFAHVPVGSCSLDTDVQGFTPVSTSFNSTAAESIYLPLSLELEAMYTGLMVIGPPLDASLRAAISKTRSPRHECDQDAGSR